jgi:hypothetical protein
LQSGIARSFFAISFCFISVLFFFRNFFADVICRQLAARIPDKPFFHPPVFFPGLEDDSSYTQRGPQGGMSLATLLSLDISGFVFLQSHFLFLQMSPLFFYSNYGFCNFVIFVNIRFPLSLFLMTCS